MFYIGALTFLSSCYILYRAKQLNKKIIDRMPVYYLEHKQSTIHEIVKVFMPTNEQIKKFVRESKKISSQSKQTYQEGMIKVVVVGQIAYWIQDNTLYQTEVTEDGEIDSSLAMPVTADDMSHEEIEILMKIVDDLRSNENDGSSSGD